MGDFLNWVVSHKEIKTHMDAGKVLAAKVKGLKLTVDVYGKGADGQGSPWKIQGDKTGAIETALLEMGFTKAGKASFRRGNVSADIGKGKYYTYIYFYEDEK